MERKYASFMDELVSPHRSNHENLLAMVEGLTDEQIAWTPN